MYLDDIADVIRAHIPKGRIPKGDSQSLLRMYAVLLRSKGPAITEGDVHDVWSAWMAAQDHGHPSLVPYDQLEKDIQGEDIVFTNAIRRAAEQVGWLSPARSSLSEVLFPSGPPKSEEDARQYLELYKIMVQSSETLVGRRQAVNTFFLTIQGALLTAGGLIIQRSVRADLAAMAIGILALAGMIFSISWRSLIISFGQLNRGKFKVINDMECQLKVALYTAEWEALNRGENPDIYRSFTSREIWVPNALLFLHALATIGATVVALGGIKLGPG